MESYDLFAETPPSAAEISEILDEMTGSACSSNTSTQLSSSSATTTEQDLSKYFSISQSNNTVTSQTKSPKTPKIPEVS